jgi:polyhydroxyalkanoate synthesis regulator phasin
MMYNQTALHIFYGGEIMGIATRLRQLLGAESAGAWIDFMDMVHRELPFLTAPGRPKKADIEASEIGRSGFGSWVEMIEAPVDKGGLGWNRHSWNAWRRAYRLVRQYPYLRGLGLTASQINTAAQKAKTFPTTADEWWDLQSKMEQEACERHQRSLSEAQAQAREWQEKAKTLEARLAQANDDLRRLEWMRSEERERLQSQITTLKNQIDELEQTSKRLRSDNSRLEMEKLALERRLREWSNLPWYKRIFTRP